VQVALAQVQVALAQVQVQVQQGPTKNLVDDHAPPIAPVTFYQALS
jgi:hypothetical protein